MPGMDGLELLRRVSRQYPHLPVIIMTAHGNEEVALEALIEGAVDYVPKNRLTTSLPQAVQSVLAAADGRGRERLSACVESEAFRFVLENDPRLVGELAAHVRASASELKITDQQNDIRLAKAVGEAVRNAMFHGNLELESPESQLAGDDVAMERVCLERSQQAPYRDRRVHVDAEFCAMRLA